MRTPRIISAVAAAALAGAPAALAGPLTISGPAALNRPAYVQLSLPLAGAPPLTATESQVEALDPEIADGRAVVQVRRANLRVAAPAVTRAGVRVRVTRRPGRALVLLDAAPDRFAFTSYAVIRRPARLVIRLWKATTDPAAAIRSDGCLRITRWSGGRGRATARGLELQPLFEHGLVLSLRADGRGGSTLGERPVTATPGRFRADFSGYARPGRWRGTVRAAVGTPTRAMLQAWVASAKDGALQCLVQVPVVVRP
ncbi:MAG: hypothetical protein AB7V42_15485 [Thermoleophilia bacterium]